MHSLALTRRAAAAGLQKRSGVKESRRRKQYLERQRAKQLAAKRALVRNTRASKAESTIARQRKARRAAAARRGGPVSAPKAVAPAVERDSTDYFGFSDVPNRRELLRQREQRLKNDTWTRITRYEASQVTNEVAADIEVIRLKQTRQTAMFDGQLVEKEARRRAEAAEKLKHQRIVQRNTARYGVEDKAKQQRIEAEAKQIAALRERQLREVLTKRASDKERKEKEEHEMVAAAHAALMEERERNRLKMEAAIALRNRVLEENMVQLRARKAAKLHEQVEAQRLIDAYREKLDKEAAKRKAALAATYAKQQRRVELQMVVMKGVDDLAREDAERALREQAKKEREALAEEIRRKRHAAARAMDAQQSQLAQIARKKRQIVEERQRMRTYADGVIARNIEETAAEARKTARRRAEGEAIARVQERQIRELRARRLHDPMPKREQKIHAQVLRKAEQFVVPRRGRSAMPKSTRPW